MNRKVTVVGGAGNVGATVARAIATKELADVVIVDIAETKAAGIARIGEREFNVKLNSSPQFIDQFQALPVGVNVNLSPIQMARNGTPWRRSRSRASSQSNGPFIAAARPA